MIEAKGNITGKISYQQSLKGQLNNAIEKVYPELEDITITPTSIEQNFKSSMYGYDNVKVKAVASDNLDVTPTTEQQQYIGLYGTVNVEAVDNSIDENIKAENIKEGINILGVTGVAPKPKEEEVKTIDITENGSYKVLPDEGKALSEVNVDVDVSSDFIGIKYSNYSGEQYNLPRTADARSFDKILEDPNDENIDRHKIATENNHCLAYAFASPSANANGGYTVQLEEVYLPSKVTSLAYTFQNCSSLKRIIGDMKNIKNLNVTFSGCKELEEIPYFPNLEQVGNQTFMNCTKLKEICLPASVTTVHTGAFSNATGLENLIIPEGWKLSLKLSASSLLTTECINNLIENLATVSTTQTLTLHANVKANLTDEQIASITSKNWTLA